ncbi:hypothetical protein H8S95_11255 [Pontibacter sp. KCTC 32443]|uniref:hypothetical protein n=1 Tax=Pontibacter TaxID=323449 RepID=UPI00164DE94A|nr:MULTISPECIES: hypothetical protein [Pontibacter]MBC5774640.1 hypothetical protein [Pontibacter sp. KCTC 32443]
MGGRRSNSSGKWVIAALVAYVAVVAIFRRKYVNWGSTKEEQLQPLPGDELMDHASAHHAITIHAPVTEVWAWLVQIGQDRAGFYSYSFLENLVRADIHNADSIVPEWQHLKAGDTIRLGSRKVYGDKTLLRVTALEENHFIVLQGWGAFVLQPLDAHTTRFIIRSHGQKEGWLKRMLLFLLFDPIHFIMERRMMLGIKERAERKINID